MTTPDTAGRAAGEAAGPLVGEAAGPLVGDAAGPLVGDAADPFVGDAAGDRAGRIDLEGLDALAARAVGLMRDDRRVILGITGSPGAGKTTLATTLAARVNDVLGTPGTAVHLPMDGYHLANATLDRLNIHDRKGAIETFDGWGFVALLRRLHDEYDHVVYAPSFDRSVDEGIAGEIAVTPDARLVIVEGNYLLVEQSPWSSVAALLAESWFCETSDAERLQRLVDRHERHGRTPEAAAAWATTVDGANALLIEASLPRATLVVSGTDASVGRQA